MFSTRQVLVLLRQANPHAQVDEERLRRLLRKDLIPAPSSVPGRLLWHEAEVEAAALALGLAVPSATLRERLDPRARPPSQSGMAQ